MKPWTTSLPEVHNAAQIFFLRSQPFSERRIFLLLSEPSVCPPAWAVGDVELRVSDVQETVQKA